MCTIERDVNTRDEGLDELTSYFVSLRYPEQLVNNGIKKPEIVIEHSFLHLSNNEKTTKYSPLYTHTNSRNRNINFIVHILIK